ncbi:hypothetical protein [Jiulongibacter sediminis]|jgi:hypothetical protein|nr:hypothetical protein [Jiulongibacter sediminis]
MNEKEKIIPKRKPAYTIGARAMANSALTDQLKKIQLQRKGSKMLFLT